MKLKKLSFSELLMLSHRAFYRTPAGLKREWPRVLSTSDCHRGFLVAPNRIVFRVANI